jgi:hypothetical protein
MAVVANSAEGPRWRADAFSMASKTTVAEGNTIHEVVFYLATVAP